MRIVDFFEFFITRRQYYFNQFSDPKIAIDKHTSLGCACQWCQIEPKKKVTDGESINTEWFWRFLSHRTLSIEVNVRAGVGINFHSQQTQPKDASKARLWGAAYLICCWACSCTVFPSSPVGSLDCGMRKWRGCRPSSSSHTNTPKVAKIINILL